MSDFELVKCTDLVKWTAFVSSSIHGNKYALAEVISALGCSADYWFINRKGNPVAAIPIITHNSVGQGLPIHSYYVGIMLHPEVTSSKANRRTECEIAITQFAMEALSPIYDHFELSLHPTMKDIRGFDWFNYHTPQNGRVVISPQYTAISNLQPITNIRDAARGSRRREEKYAFQRESLLFSYDGTVDELLSLYKFTFVRQEIELTNETLKATRQFAEYLIESQQGDIAVVRDEEGRAVAAGLVMYDFQKFVHVPIVGTGESRYGGTLLYFQMMEHAAKKGYQYMDFNGANSPNRGYFKHSIGAKAQLFFHVRWVRP